MSSGGTACQWGEVLSQARNLRQEPKLTRHRARELVRMCKAIRFTHTRSQMSVHRINTNRPSGGTACQWGVVLSQVLHRRHLGQLGRHRSRELVVRCNAIRSIHTTSQVSVHRVNTHMPSVGNACHWGVVLSHVLHRRQQPQLGRDRARELVVRCIAIGSIHTISYVSVHRIHTHMSNGGSAWRAGGPLTESSAPSARPSPWGWVQTASSI